MKIVTHDGVFHADEVFGVAVLEMLFLGVEVVRTRDPEVIKTADFAIDVGGGDYDHHHQSFSLCRKSGTKYASAGLVWASFGPMLVSKLADSNLTGLLTEIAQDVDSRLIEIIDAVDNGEAESGPGGINRIISTFNSLDNGFEMAVSFAKTVLKAQILSSITKVEDKAELDAEVARQIGADILYLGRPLLGSKEAAADAGFRVVVFYDRAQDRFCVSQVKQDRLATSPEAWRGLSDEALKAASGIDTAVFCHAGGWFCVASDIKGANVMASAMLARV